MNISAKRLWLALAIFPFLVPLILLTFRFAASAFPSLPAANLIFGFVSNFWWLFFIVVAFIDWLAYLVHAQHSMAIPDDDRQTWTMLIFFLTPFANLFYYQKFISRRGKNVA